MTSPTPADEFAAILRGDAASAPPMPPDPAEPARRAPKPDPSQGAGADGGPGLSDPASAFVDALNRAVPSADGSGNWVQL